MFGSKLEFDARDPRLGWACAALAGIFAAYLGLSFASALNRPGFHRFGDFFALWSSAKLAWGGSAAANYDMDALHAWQLALGMEPSERNPFPYPPFFLLALAPLGALGYGAAYGLAMASSAAGYFWAVAAARVRKRPILAAALLAPSSAVCLIAGQTGFLSAALTLGGLRIARERPLAAGILIGLASYKPQLVALVPIALVAAGLWRVLAAAAATTLILAIAAGAAFGSGIWAAWLADLPLYSQQFDAHSLQFHLMPTVTANLEMLDASAPLAHAAQGALALALAFAVWRRFRSGVSPQAAMLLVAAGFLATPHAFVYDLPLLTGAIFWFLEERLEAEAPFTLGEAAILVLGLILPAAMVWSGERVPISWLPEMLLFALFARETTRGPAPG